MVMVIMDMVDIMEDTTEGIMGITMVITDIITDSIMVNHHHGNHQ
jgi:hypothetical protein